MKSMQGKFLLASAMLTDPNFARAVVLIVQHDENGALGLIVNRPIKTTIQQVCSEALGMQCAVDGPLHVGGPCEGPLMIVHTRAIDSQIELRDGLYFTTDQTQIESLLLDEAVTAKCFVGYAGWSPGQLEDELESGAWLEVNSTTDEVFLEETGPEQWERLMKKITLGQWIDPKRIPSDPNVN